MLAHEIYELFRHEQEAMCSIITMGKFQKVNKSVN